MVYLDIFLFEKYRSIIFLMSVCLSVGLSVREHDCSQSIVATELLFKPYIYLVDLGIC